MEKIPSLDSPLPFNSTPNYVCKAQLLVGKYVKEANMESR